MELQKLGSQLPIIDIELLDSGNISVSESESGICVTAETHQEAMGDFCVEYLGWLDDIRAEEA